METHNIVIHRFDSPITFITIIGIEKNAPNVIKNTEQTVHPPLSTVIGWEVLIGREPSKKSPIFLQSQSPLEN